MKSINEAITKLLSERLQRRVDQKLDKNSCTEIYQDIFFTLSEVFQQANAPINNEAVNLLAQMYYDSVTVNGNQELDPNIFSQRASFENIPTKEIAFLASIMRETPFAPVFLSQIKKRS